MSPLQGQRVAEDTGAGQATGDGADEVDGVDLDSFATDALAELAACGTLEDELERLAVDACPLADDVGDEAAVVIARGRPSASPGRGSRCNLQRRGRCRRGPRPSAHTMRRPSATSNATPTMAFAHSSPRRAPARAVARRRPPAEHRLDCRLISRASEHPGILRTYTRLPNDPARCATESLCVAMTPYLFGEPLPAPSGVNLPRH
jgi:hypothetical protein